MSAVLDRYVFELEQFRAIRKAANAWTERTDLPGEYEAAERLSELASEGMYGSALSYVGANEAIRELAGETRPRDGTRVHRCVRCGLSPAEADHRGAWTFPFSRTCPSCSALTAPAKRRRH